MLLTAEHLYKNYGMKQLLSDSSLFLDEGQKLGVIGLNGTGKSTLLRILAGVEEPDGGCGDLDCPDLNPDGMHADGMDLYEFYQPDQEAAGGGAEH